MRVHAISTGTVQVTERQRRGEGPARQLRTMLDRRWTDPLPIWVWVIEHPDGVIVVDTGETARVAEPGWFPRWHPYFRAAVRLVVRPEEEIGPQLRERGIDPSHVAKVVLTHLHTDHAGGLAHFRGSEILCSRGEHRFATGRLGKARGYLPHRLPAWFAPSLVVLDSDPWGPFPASLPLTGDGDVRLVPTRGHTPGHVSVVVDEGERVLFLAGDTSYSDDLLMDDAVDGVAPDPRAARETMARIRELAAQRPTVYLPTHDPGAGRRLEERSPLGA